MLLKCALLMTHVWIHQHHHLFLFYIYFFGINVVVSVTAADVLLFMHFFLSFSLPLFLTNFHMPGYNNMYINWYSWEATCGCSF